MENAKCDLKTSWLTPLLIEVECKSCGFYAAFNAGTDVENDRFIELATANHERHSKMSLSEVAADEEGR